MRKRAPWYGSVCTHSAQPTERWADDRTTGWGSKSATLFVKSLVCVCVIHSWAFGTRSILGGVAGDPEAGWGTRIHTHRHSCREITVIRWPTSMSEETREPGGNPYTHTLLCLIHKPGQKKKKSIAYLTQVFTLIFLCQDQRYRDKGASQISVFVIQKKKRWHLILHLLSFACI